MKSILSVVLLLLLAIGCAPTQARRGAMDPASLQDAMQGLAELERMALESRHAELLPKAREMLRQYPGFEDNDRVMLLAARSALELDDARTADQMLRDLLESYADGPQAKDAWWESAQLAELRDDPLRSARAYTEFHALADGDPRRAEAEEALRVLLDERLSLEQLEELAEDYPQSVIGSTVHWRILEELIEMEAEPQLLMDRSVDFLEAYPQSRHADEVYAILARLRREHDLQVPGDVQLVLDDRIGILVPLTGENAALGQAMYDGALLALEEHNRLTGEDLKLISLDTRADGVRAVQMAQSLIDREGVVAIVGALLSHTTIPVAVLCEQRQVPLLSPTATQETISELGSHVFQTNLTRSVETRLVAHAAVELLLRRRFAILHGDSEEGRTAAELFRAQVEGLGAEVVAVEALDRGSTDARDVLQRLRQAGPEAIFAPLTPSEMRLVAPQLNFVGLETQLLGPSSWNNSLLNKEVSDYLDRAVFPSDIALIPQAEAERFEELWSRRFRGQPSNPFALKTYFAVRTLLQGMSQGHRTRLALRDYLEQLFGLGGETTLGMEKLRMLDGRDFVAFPLDEFPRPSGPERQDFKSGLLGEGGKRR